MLAHNLAEVVDDLPIAVEEEDKAVVQAHTVLACLDQVVEGRHFDHHPEVHRVVGVESHAVHNHNPEAAEGMVDVNDLPFVPSVEIATLNLRSDSTDQFTAIEDWLHTDRNEPLLPMSDRNVGPYNGGDQTKTLCVIHNTRDLILTE